ncbi:MAG: hypothetical protein GWN61_23865, partial [candidate division Zixibacteria bacterium]|nr:hypothetical protein [candidate division Zixibacteria bacterium]NIR52645.1 hypothetical protein [candidate division KSB1 bacterium]NIR67639.1 hypothetical protein [candidate division Zixibacteria bacterium]NIS48897.1 hypothetical protein [candidate division Zixibacteria bacterium]NIT74828.1 hypothetical protein [candidate division KSB1 bacterium]
MGTKFNPITGKFDLDTSYGANIDDIDGITGNKGDILVHDGTNFVDVSVGADGLVLTADSAQSSGVKWGAVAGSGDVVGPASSTDNAIVRFDGTTGKAIQDSGIIIDDLNNMTIYEATNDANPEIKLGAADAEELHIQTVYDSGAQTLDYVLFQTDAASATADKGAYRFNVDGSDILDIDDGGIDLDANKGISINGTDIITDSGGTATLSNIDALDATTEATIEAAIDTLANLTSAT